MYGLRAGRKTPTGDNKVEILLFLFRVRFLLDFFDFFYDHVLFSLRNPRTKFRAAVLSRCGAMLKMGGNTTISFPGAFLIGFL